MARPPQSPNSDDSAARRPATDRRQTLAEWGLSRRRESIERNATSATSGVAAGKPYEQVVGPER
ncbi:hypothetical protein GJR96_07455 [Haloferax sp. MBLA0076]|uniref:Uncharacterized protein n=1 Tax=Haloferax litoreum TaxID=2666140 RepID=A0A6A8GG74_9EURY|nr:hypothetical protein Hfx1148_07450 [Haloferax sp. CBA1148]MRX21791.1 hypothetical protein [Haloferax litoreum]